MSHIIPPRLDNPEPKERRFYVVAESSVYLALQEEAHHRGTDLWTLGGLVLTAWLAAGRPSTFADSPLSPSSSPSHSVAGDQEGVE